MGRLWVSLLYGVCYLRVGKRDKDCGGLESTRHVEDILTLLQDAVTMVANIVGKDPGGLQWEKNLID